MNQPAPDRNLCAPSKPLEQLRLTVMVVGANTTSRDAIVTMLDQNGCLTQVTSIGDEPVDLLSRTTPDLVLIDSCDSKAEAYSTLAKFRNLHDRRSLPIIMIVANDDLETPAQAIKNGANDCIVWPASLDLVMARIDTHRQLIESRKQFRDSSERYELIAAGTNDGLWDWNLRTEEIHYSTRWLTMFGIDQQASPSFETWSERIHVDDRLRIETDLQRHRTGQADCFETEMRMRHSDGSYRWMLCRGIAARDEQGVAYRIAGSLSDITEGKVADALTGLPNRVLFKERLERNLQKQARDPLHRFALMYLDLDNFKLVNDNLGHDAGDRLLVSIARRLESSLREADSFVCRLGGDEFAILVEDVDSRNVPVRIAERILSSVQSPISVGNGREVFASLSVGISYSGDNFDSGSEMLQAADTAMYRAKDLGKSCYQVFDPAMRRDSTRRSELTKELRNAIESGQISLNYQPIVNLETSKVTGFEALARWNHPRFGTVPPAEFIPIAEETGLIGEIGKYVLFESCRQLAIWRNSFSQFQNIFVSVNVSSVQIKCDQIVEDVASILDITKLPATALQLEVTEDFIMHNPERSETVLAQLRALNVKIAIDDFGTGYSSLSCIQEIAPNAVKIDRSFIDQIKTSNDQETIVRTFVTMAEGLKLDVIAEGVETFEQYDLLRSIGCQSGQGFLFARPMSPTDFEAMVCKPRTSTFPATNIYPSPSVTASGS